MSFDESPLARIVEFTTTATLVALVNLTGISLVHAGETVLSGTVDYSVLTPAFEGNFIVRTRYSVPPLVPVDLASGFINTKRTNELRALVVREHYSATEHLASRLAEALTEAGLSADVVEVPRGPVGTPNRLHREDLPAHTTGRHLINISIEYVGLLAMTNLSSWEPALWLRWQVIRPDGQVVMAPRRYVHGPGSDDKDGGEHRTISCDLGLFSAAMGDPGKVWNCFDLAIREASVTIARAIKDAQHGP